MLHEGQCDFYLDMLEQSIPFSSQLIQPASPIVALVLTYDGKDWLLKTLPVVAMKHSVKEEYAKFADEDEEFDPDEQKALHNCDELIEAGYEYHGRMISTDVLVVYDGRIVDFGYIMHLLKWKFTEYTPGVPSKRIGIEYVGRSALAYPGDESQMDSMKKDVLKQYQDALKALEEGDDDEEEDDE